MCRARVQGVSCVAPGALMLTFGASSARLGTIAAGVGIVLEAVGVAGGGRDRQVSPKSVFAFCFAFSFVALLAFAFALVALVARLLVLALLAQLLLEIADAMPEGTKVLRWSGR